MRSKIHIPIPIYGIPVQVAYWIAIQGFVSNANWQQGAFRQKGSLKKGTAEFPYCVSVGAGTLGKKHYLEALIYCGSKFLDFLGQRHEFFAVCVQATAIAGDCSQKRIVTHLNGSDENKIIQSCQEDNVGVGNMVADGKKCLVAHRGQLFRVMNLSLYAKCFAEFSGYAGGVSGLFGAPGYLVSGNETDEKS